MTHSQSGEVSSDSQLAVLKARRDLGKQYIAVRKICVTPHDAGMNASLCGGQVLLIDAKVFHRRERDKRVIWNIAAGFRLGWLDQTRRAEGYGGKYPFIQTGDVRNAGHFITEFSQTYSDVGLDQSKLWPKGTICITIAANIAETGILGFDACFPDSVIGVVPNPAEAEIGFVEYLLQSFKARIQAMGQGSAQANINMGTFEHEQFPFPGVAEQRKIVVQLDDLSEQTQRLESIYQQKLAALDELKKSLLHHAFSGKL